MNILLILIIFMAGIVTLIICSNWYMQFCLKLMVNKKHEYLDFILATSCAPEQWSRPYAKRISWMTDQNFSPEQIQRVRNRAQGTCLRRLNKLIKYVHVATLIQDEAIRSQIKKSLQMVSEEWQKGEGIVYEYTSKS